MHSLYSALLVQHSRQLTSVRCAEQTIAQLHRYFEDVVLENNLAALVIESLPEKKERSLRELARVREIGKAAYKTFFFISPNDALNDLPLRTTDQHREPILIKRPNAESEERFVVIADARFSALLASVHPTEGDGSEGAGDDVIWTFEPDIVYSALEYLMARVAAERPVQAPVFSTAVRSSMPKATSLQLTVSVTTKLARLLQEQAGREVAINRIATAIRSSLELDSVLQKTVAEVGRALNVQHCALRIAGTEGQSDLTHCFYRSGADSEPAEEAELMGDLDAYRARLMARPKTNVVDGRSDSEPRMTSIRPLAAVPLLFQERFLGVLLVRSHESARVWQENEVLLLQTVADQVAVAVNHARLFGQLQLQALTDELTGCFNRRSFEMQLERDLQMAARLRLPLTLILLDIDNFKNVNDTYGHDAGDQVLRVLANNLREELRGVDTAARYGGEEFAIILPQADSEGALLVAERLRANVEGMVIPQVGQITVSLGVATFPLNASSRDTLVVTADRALYEAKNSGRNRVCMPHCDPAPCTDDAFNHDSLPDPADHPEALAAVDHF
jgi:diguanylate cyclase (GGDEF)-like protein